MNEILRNKKKNCYPVTNLKGKVKLRKNKKKYVWIPKKLLIKIFKKKSIETSKVLNKLHDLNSETKNWFDNAAKQQLAFD